MTQTLAPPRTGSSPRIQLHPMRFPDTTDRAVMTRRAWWLVLLNWFIPGSAQVLAGNRRLGRLGLTATLISWTIAVLLIAFALLWRDLLFTIAVNPIVLVAAALVMVAYLVLWVVLTLDTLRLVRLVRARPRARLAVALVSIALLVINGAVVGYAVPRMVAASSALASIFSGGAPAAPPSDGYYNILLLGADSGQGRDSMRFDSISVASINADTGRVTITGIPRELSHVPFSESSPMRELYPDGFTGQASASCGWNAWMNHIRQAAEVCREDGGVSLYPDAAAHDSSPGVEATKDAAEGLLGIEIPYYLFLDMDGFAALVDALGGVDMNVSERLPEGPGPAFEGQPADQWATGWIEPGAQHMDGETAQWYARSRYTTSDWDRMQRQRQLQEAILAQFTPQNVISRFQDVAAAGSTLVETDIPQSMLSTFISLAAKAKEQPVTSIELTPEGTGVDQENPDIAAIQALVRQAMHPNDDGASK